MNGVDLEEFYRHESYELEEIFSDQKAKVPTFRDGNRQIDMILCYQKDENPDIEKEKKEQRKIFEEKLELKGLELEYEDRSRSQNGKLYFVKIRLSDEDNILSEYAEALKIKKPIKEFKIEYGDDCKTCEDFGEGSTKCNAITNEPSISEKFSKSRRKFKNKIFELFDFNRDLIHDESFYDSIRIYNPKEIKIEKIRCDSYNNSQRNSIVMQILQNTDYEYKKSVKDKVEENSKKEGKNENDKVEKNSRKMGIQSLINQKVYLACFPLHEELQTDNFKNCTDRTRLRLEWASFKKIFTNQPMNLIRKYFGEKIALYFCWLDFYTKMLIIPAIVGLFCILYAYLTLDWDENLPSKEICDDNINGTIKLCPLCENCTFRSLSESCKYAQITYWFDNYSTVVFSIIMSFWAILFLEFWKRKQNTIIWEWDLEGAIKNEEIRPEYELTTVTKRKSPITKKWEPYTPFHRRIFKTSVSIGSVIFVALIIIAAIVGVMAYRISLFKDEENSKLMAMIKTGCLNFAIIIFLTKIYRKLAILLTKYENPRTETEYENSYAIKTMVFEFINFYGSLIYIAFFKGIFFQHPLSKKIRLTFEKENCEPAGCISELCVQLAIIMTLKQAWNGFIAYAKPIIVSWVKKFRYKTKESNKELKPWEHDYNLQDLGRLPLFEEYKEMIIQYGFVTLFVAAFPLAPIFALINNIFEVRMDAKKMLLNVRRPIAERTEEIGAWYSILNVITHTAVVTNAFLIAFTSDFIPKMYYKLYYSQNMKLTGYINHSLSKVNVSELVGYDVNKLNNTEFCYFRGYKEDFYPYNRKPDFWIILVWKLSFVVIFEHFLFLSTGIVKYMVTDTPKEITIQKQLEQSEEKNAQLDKMQVKTRTFKEVLGSDEDRKSKRFSRKTSVISNSNSFVWN